MAATGEMLGGYRLAPLRQEDAGAALLVFNEHVTSGFAAYAEAPVPESFIVDLLGGAAGYPAIGVEDESGALIGFGLLRPYSSISAFGQTAVETIFIGRTHTGCGLGSAVLKRLLEGAREKGITRVLAHIASKNEGSVRFHARHGFVECGRFPGVARKWGETFDIVWMVKAVDPPAAPR